MIEFRMPSLGADMEAGFLREWKVKPGDHIQRGDIIAEVETQKGIIDIEVFDEGVISQLLIEVDDKVPVGTLMAYITSEGETPDEAPEIAGTEYLKVGEKKADTTGTKVVAAIAEPPAPAVHHVRASPLARRIAEEKGIDINSISGSGPDGAILREDVERAATERTSPSAPAKETVTDNIRMAVAAAMSKSNREIPHYYLHTRVDMSKALQWLAEANKGRPAKDRLLPAVLLIKAVAKALTEVPELNAWWDNGLQRKDDIHIGFVVSLRTGGIIVPAIHDAGKKTLNELMLTLSDVIPRARALRLKSSELADSTITITSLGDGGAEAVYGVIYPPQVALVGFGGITEEPVAENGMVGARPVMTITLAADHRASDGATGNRFLLAVKKYLNQPEQL